MLVWCLLGFKVSEEHVITHWHLNAVLGVSIGNRLGYRLGIVWGVGWEPFGVSLRTTSSGEMLLTRGRVIEQVCVKFSGGCNH